MNTWAWLTSLLARRQRRDPVADFDRELQSHLQLETEEQQESGISTNESKYAARRAFGSTTLVTEDVRAIWTAAWLEAFLRDLRYAARTLCKNPGFALVAILTLALGIGANTAIFSVIESVLLQPLPFPDADQIVRIYSAQGGTPAALEATGVPPCAE